MKSEENRKLKAFARFALLVALPGIIGFIFLIQLFDPSLFGERYPALCWSLGLGLIALAAWELYIVSKGSNTGNTGKNS